MSVKVACDVCRHLYHVPESRLKTEQKCRECTAVFKMIEFDEEAERKFHQPDSPSILVQVWEWTKTGATSVLVLAVLGMLLSLLWVDPRAGTWASSRNSPRNSYASNRSANRTPQQNYRPNSNRPPSYQAPVNNSTASSTGPRPFPTTPSPHIDVNKRREEAMNRANEMMEKMQADHQATMQELTQSPIIEPPQSAPMNPSPESGMQFGPSSGSSIGSRPPSFPRSRFSPRIPNSGSGADSYEATNPPVIRGGDNANAWTTKYRGPSPLRPPSGKRVSSIAQLKPKQIIAVQHGSMWYPADVMEIQGDKVKIHYRGWSNSWDEVVPLSRTQLAHDGVNVTE